VKAWALSDCGLRPEGSRSLSPAQRAALMVADRAMRRAL